MAAPTLSVEGLSLRRNGRAVLDGVTSALLREQGLFADEVAAKGEAARLAAAAMAHEAPAGCSTTRST